MEKPSPDVAFSTKVKYVLVGQDSINLRDDCGQLAQAQPRPHDAVIVADLERRHTEKNVTTN